MIDTELAFISLYVAEKEFSLERHLKKALDHIHILMKHGKDKTLAVWYTNKKYPIYTKEFLIKKFNSRSAHIKNAKREFKFWEISLREKAAGVQGLCKCGCGKVVKRGNKFIHGHHKRLMSKEAKIAQAELMRDAKKKKKEAALIIL